MIPGHILKDAVFRSHMVRADSENKLKQAQALLEYYRDHAGLVITTRLHCALPCVAMGIPVVFFSDPFDYRVSVAESVGLKIHRTEMFSRKLKPTGILHRYLRAVDHGLLGGRYRWLCRSMWNPMAIDIKEHRRELEKNVENHLNVILERLDREDPDEAVSVQ
jgi:hypothetical protein